jgi:hypothetical protein
VSGVFDFAVFAIGRADEADRSTAVALNFEMKGKRFAFDGYQMSISTGKSNHKMPNVWLQMKCKMAADQVLKRFSRQIRKEDAFLLVGTATPGAKALVNLDPDGLALQGYDPVAFFTDAEPVVGDAKFQSNYCSAAYRFVSGGKQEDLRSSTKLL